MSALNHFASLEERALFELFLGDLSRRGRSAATQRSYRSDWTDLCLTYRRLRGQLFEAAALDVEVVTIWRDRALARGQSAATVNRRMAFARSYAAWLLSEQILRMETIEAIRTGTRGQRVAGGPKILTPEAVHRLLSQVDVRGCRRDQAILYVLLDAGLKVGELVALDVGDVDFSQGALRVNGRWERQVTLPTRAARKLAWSLGERGLLDLPEDGKIVLPASGGWPPDGRILPPDPARLPSLSQVPLSPMPLSVLGSPAAWPLFVGDRGRLSSNAVQRVVRKHSTFARVAATPQALRHTFAYGYWMRTGDLVGLAEALGHESVETTRIYTRIEPPEPEVVVEAHALG